MEGHDLLEGGGWALMGKTRFLVHVFFFPEWYWVGYAKIQYVIEGSWDLPVEEPYWGSISTFEKKPENISWNDRQPDDKLWQACASKVGLDVSYMYSDDCKDFKYVYICEFNHSTYRSG